MTTSLFDLLFTFAAGTHVHGVDEAAAVGTLEEVTADPTAAELPGDRTADAGEAELTYRQDAGGYLRHFVIYDVVCFALVTAYIVAYGVTSGALEAEGVQWQFRMTCVFGKTVYGLLSLPFIAFVTPPFNSVLTRAKPTAYDQAGDAVPLLNARQRLEKARIARGEPARPPPKPGMYGRAKAQAERGGTNARATAAAAGARVQGLNFRGGKSTSDVEQVEQML
jgi:hypothetical protein